MEVNVQKITEEKLVLNFEAIKTEKAKQAYIEEIKKFFDGDEEILSIIRHTLWLFNGIENPISLRITTPKELGYENGLAPWGRKECAEKHNLKSCPAFTAFKIAMAFEEIKKQIPEEYLKWSWSIHMSPIDYGMSGDKFISGLGCPDPIFKISPYTKNFVGVKWIYRGQIDSTDADEVIVFTCR